jgi:hypothetical protein
MGTPVADSKTPALAAFGLVAFGLVIAAVQGLTHGSIAGGVIAGLGAVPACYGMWKGIRWINSPITARWMCWRCGANGRKMNCA